MDDLVYNDDGIYFIRRMCIMKKAFLLSFVLIMILFAVSCSEKHNEADALIADGASSFVITRSDTAGSSQIDCAVELRKAIKEKIGIDLSMGTDFYKEGNPNFAIPEYEILVGSTNRDEYREVAVSIPKNCDWLIARKGSKVIIGGTDKLSEAVDYFIENYVVDGNIYVPDGELYVKTGEYKYDSITLGSKQLYECEVIYASNDSAAKSLAEEFVSGLKTDYGYSIKLSTRGSANSPAAGEIAFYTEDITGDAFKNSCIGGESLTISCGFLSSLSDSAEMLYEWMDSNMKDGSITIDQSLKLEVTKENNKMKIADEKLFAELDTKADAMKAAVLGAESEYTVGEGGKIYYFAADGKDSNDGLSPETPKQTIDALTKLTLKSGDVVLFKRGDTFRGKFSAAAGVTYSAYGEGDKPTINGSLRNYADPMDWNETDYPNVWKYSGKLENVGIILFDYTGEIGNYEEKYGTMRISGASDGFVDESDLDGDLQFWSDIATNELFVYSEENPGKRFKSIEIGTSGNVIAVGGNKGVTVDNLHIMLTGSHGVGAGTTAKLTVRNCVFDWLGGSILKGFSGGNTTRYGNAVEVYGGVDCYKVYNNWMYQIYDTGITHQFNVTADTAKNVMNDVEYYDNLIEYCFWSIEYYNAKAGEGTYRETTNVNIHDNFCRLGGYGWGCKGRESSAPMYCIGSMPDKTENYVTSNNIFDRCTGYLVSTYGQATNGDYKFIGNTYVQPYGARLSQIDGGVQLYDGSAAENLKKYLDEDDPVLYYIMETEEAE